MRGEPTTTPPRTKTMIYLLIAAATIITGVYWFGETIGTFTTGTPA